MSLNIYEGKKPDKKFVTNIFQEASPLLIQYNKTMIEIQGVRNYNTVQLIVTSIHTVPYALKKI